MLRSRLADIRFSGLKVLMSIAIMAMANWPAEAAEWEQARDRINSNTVTILSGNPQGTYLFIASDIAFVVDDGDDMRILPIVGKGGAQNVRDLIYLRNVDMAIVRSDAFETYDGEQIFGNLDGQLRYISRLYNEEMHILTRNDIKSVDDLQGAAIAISNVGSGTQLTSALVFKRLGIKFTEFNGPQRDAYEALKSGKLDAMVIVAGKPVNSWKGLDVDRDRFHMIPVPWPKILQDFYLPTKITHDDYPNLLGEGEEIETIAASAILASYNWKAGSQRYERVARFVDHFFSKVAEGKFQSKARHPKWKEVNIASELPTWERFEPATIWLRENQQPMKNQDLERQFMAFINQNTAPGSDLTENQKSALFEHFLKWRNTRAGDGLTASN